MAIETVLPDRTALAADTPIRIAVAAALAFPDGSMKAGGLRRERDAGRLETWITAGKEYTSLAAIDEMTRRCREERRARSLQPSISPARTPHQSASEEQQSQIALAAALARCETRSPKKLSHEE